MSYKYKMRLLFLFVLIFNITACDSKENNRSSKDVITENALPSTILESESNKIRHELIGDYMTEAAAHKYLLDRAKILPTLKSFSLQELLEKVKVLPDGGAYLPKGDYYAEAILNRGDAIVPALIESVKEVSKLSQVKSQGDVFNYFIGDVAAMLIQHATSKGFSLEEYFLSEYKEELGESPETAVSYIGLPQTYIRFLFESVNPEKSNKNNRIHLYKYLKQWQKEVY